MMKTIIFDLDGTLLNTLEDLYLSVNAALAAFDFPERTIDEVRCFVGNGVRKLMQRSVPDGENNPQFEDCFLAFQKHYAVHLNDHTGPYDGILQLLDQLLVSGYPMAIVSNKSDYAVKELNQKMFGKRIAVAIGEMEGIRRKPEPDTVLTAARELGVRLEDCVYVGDSEVDLETAKNCGIPCIGVAWGFRGRELLEHLGAEQIAENPEELLAIIENMR
jgi:phosphoglycolate phosphatase